MRVATLAGEIKESNITKKYYGSLWRNQVILPTYLRGFRKEKALKNVHRCDK